MRFYGLNVLFFSQIKLVFNCLGWGRVSWLRNLSEWFCCISSELFKTSNKIKIALMSSNLWYEWLLTKMKKNFKLEYTQMLALVANWKKYENWILTSTLTEFLLIIVEMVQHLLLSKQHFLKKNKQRKKKSTTIN